MSKKKSQKSKSKREKAPKEFSSPQTKIRVIGIGGGGCSIVSELAKRVGKVSFVAANTDLQALKGIPKKVKAFSFGQDLTGGLGCGMDPKLGEKAAQEEKKKIKELLSGWDFCILVSTLGGGTGSGATPTFAEISKNLKNISLGIFTFPFDFEGKRKTKIAKSSFKKIAPNLNGLIIVPNQRIFKVIKEDTSLTAALSSLNKILADNLESLIELIRKPRLINIDWADFKSILKGKGKPVYLNTAKAKGRNRAKRATQKVLKSPLFKFGMKNPKRILFNISGGRDLKMSEVEKISESISEFNPRSKIIFGISQSGSSGTKKGELKITLLAVGRKERLVRKRTKKKSKKKKKTTKRKSKKKRSKKRSKKKPSSKSKKKKKKKPKKKKKKSKKKKSKKKKSTSKNRRTALEVKKAAQKREKERLAEEEKWEVPTFIRKGFKKRKSS